MKIVNLTEFRKLPEWTWYKKGSLENGFEEWCIKGETWEIDFICSSTDCPENNGSDQLWEREAMMDADSSVSFPLAYRWGRDGCFENDAKFLILEHDDLILMGEAIGKGIEATAHK